MIIQLNEAVYELYRPSASELKLEIVFFHGLQLRNYYRAYTETWMSAKGDEVWPQTWLAEDFPRARILSVSYDSSAIRGAKQGNMDMEATGRSLVDSLIRQAGVGQSNPVILVGHSLGGLVLKQVCLIAENNCSSRSPDVSLHKFLSNLKGMFFYATPHHGSGLANVVAYLPWYPSALLKYLTLLNAETESLNNSFCELRRKYNWKASGLGEAREVFVPGLSRGLIVVPEESARCDMDYFAQLGEDHVTICKPKGKTCSSYRHLIAFILSNVGKVHLCPGVPGHAAGLHSQVEYVKELLDVEPLVGIIGMAGIGKTTIAKAVFNTISHGFEFTCFIHSVKSCSTYEKLEVRILANLFQYGKKLKDCEGDWSILKGKRLLLVVDNVNSADQIRPVLDAGCSKSSCVIVTAIKQYDLRLLGFSIYRAENLNDQAAEKLFCHHAFRQPKIPAKLRYLKGVVQQVIEKCYGLPLALKLIGCCLYRSKSEEYKEEMWTEFVKSLNHAEALDGKVETNLTTILRPIYDSLGSKEQNMFVDIATIFSGLPVTKIQSAWTTSWEHSEPGWFNLMQRGLVGQIGSPLFHEELAYTHEVLRELGRSIAFESQSRVCDYRHEGQILELLGQEKENVKIKGLRLSRWSKAWGPKLDINSLFQMPDLRFLILKNVPVSGCCDKLPKSLSLLQWKVTGSSTQHLNTFSHLTKLAVLELDARAQLKKGTLDCLAESIGSLTELRVLKLQGDFKHLPPNFGDLQHLQHLSLSTGTRLTRLPHSFGSLSSLKELVISNTGVVALPDSFGLLSSLRKLRLECFHLCELPESFGLLSSLETLHLFCCEQIQMLPESFGKLLHLQSLDVSVCPKLEGLPGSFGQLSVLKKLRISYCGSLNWPLVLGPLPSLVKLELDGFDSLPDSLGPLFSLKKLRLSDIDTEHLPKGLNELPSLEVLQIQRCHFVAAWHVELHKNGWIGFHQRMAQETDSTMLEVLLYLKEGYTVLGPEKPSQIANRIITKFFPHPSRWGWPEAKEVGPVLRSSSVLLYGRSMSHIFQN